MPAIRSIVAATDLSAPARHAADRAARLAQQAGASLALVHAVSGSALDQLRRLVGAQDELPRTLLDDSRQRLHELAASLAQRYDVRVEDEVAVGASVEEIIRMAGARNAELIVTGTRGSAFVRTHLVGSTAERIVKRSGTPVLMVRQAAHEPYRRVLVPVDFSGWRLGLPEATLRRLEGPSVGSRVTGLR